MSSATVRGNDVRMPISSGFYRLEPLALAVTNPGSDAPTSADDTHSGRPSVVTLESPSVSDAVDLVRDGLEAEALITVFGRCRVDYEGRAASSLAAGERHVMLKPDGAALVHTATGQQPVNWQPPGSEHDVYRSNDDNSGTDGSSGDDSGTDGSNSDTSEGDDNDGNLVVHSTRSTPAEELVVTFEVVHQVSTFAMSEPDTIAVVGTEADLRDRLLEEPALLEPGFRPLATERETPAGAIDIYGEDRAGRTVVVELKRRRVGPDAVGQLRRYIDALSRDLHADAEIRGVLVAPSVTDRAERLLAEHDLEFVALEPTADDE
ncbi:endonuclease NucS [Natrialbaceae archaeon A-CW3]